MRKFHLLMAALMLAALSFVACKTNGPEDKPQPPTPSELTFTTEVVSVTRTSAFINVTPSDLEADYFTVIYPAYAVEQCETDIEIVAKVYAEITAFAEAQQKSFAEYMAEHVKRGKLENHEVGGLVQDTNYYLLVFGVDSTLEYTSTTPIDKKRFKTAAPQQSACTFELKASVNLTSAAISVTPSDNQQAWHLINLTVDEYNAYTAADGEYGWTTEELFQNTLNTEIETLAGEGLSNDEIGVKLFHKGMRTLNVSGLKAKTQYTTFVAGVSYEGGEAYTTTAPKELRYRSGEEANSTLSFDIDVTNIDHYSADVRITPSDLNAEYYYYISYIDTKKKAMKPQEIAESAVTEYIYYWENYTELKRREPSKGVVDLTGENKLELNIAETEYYIVAFSFEPNPTYGQVINEETGEYDQNPGTITSAPVYVSFMTSNMGDPMTAEFEFKATDVGPYDFYLEIDASDPTVYYQPGIAYYGSFDESQVMADYGTLLSQLMQMCMEGQSPSLTIWEALEEKCSAYYRNGDGRYYIANLQPEKEFMAYVLVIDARTGKFVRCVTSDMIAKTVAPGVVNPTVELLGIYNGDEEAGSVFGNADLTAGRPIVAVKINDCEGATALFSQISEGDATDASAIADQRVISEYRGYWQDVNKSVPYSFFVADWDIEQTIIAYAQDANGHEGKVGRLLVKPTGKTGEVAELKAYVDAVNNASAKAMRQSLTFEGMMEPMVECIWSEDVGAPRAGYVKYHDVEPLKLTTESDILTVKVVKSFAL